MKVEKSERELELEAELKAIKKEREIQAGIERMLKEEEKRRAAELEAQRIEACKEPNRKKMAEFMAEFRELCSRYDVYLENNGIGYDLGWTDACLGSGDDRVDQPLDED